MEHSFGEVLVRATGVSLSFGDTKVLRPTSVEVRDIVRPGMCQGQVIGVLGPSGVGKTQFCNILTGLSLPTSGTVEILGPDGKMRPVSPGDVGMVAQNYPLRPNRTVLGNLLIALERSGLPAQEREHKARSRLEMFGLAGKERLFPSQLSGGQRQRVAILQAVLCSEHFIVMDEPFTGLDPTMKKRVCETIEQVANIHEKNTIFVVAHDISALVMISDCLWLFGRDRDDNGNAIPGATVKHTYDLIERGLAWRPDLWRTSKFHDFVDEIEGLFEGL